MRQPTKKTRKISEQEAQERAINKLLADVPEEKRGPIILAVVRKVGGVTKMMYPDFETCPHCGKQRLPVQAHNGHRICRSCREWFSEQMPEQGVA